MKEKKIDRGILALIIGIAVLAVLFSGWRNLRKGVYLGNDFFYRAGDCLYQKNSVNYIRSVPEDGSIGFTISLNGKEQSASLTRQEDFVIGQKASDQFDPPHKLGKIYAFVLNL